MQRLRTLLVIWLSLSLISALATACGGASEPIASQYKNRQLQEGNADQTGSPNPGGDVGTDASGDEATGDGDDTTAGEDNEDEAADEAADEAEDDAGNDAAGEEEIVGVAANGQAFLADNGCAGCHAGGAADPGIMDGVPSQQQIMMADAKAAHTNLQNIWPLQPQTVADLEAFFASL
jgi:hypothetical protein